MEKSEFKNLEVRVEDSIATITLNRPDRLNIFNTEMLKELDKAIDQLSTNNKLKVVVLKSASQRAFTAGADIVEMEKLGPEEAKQFSKLGHKIARKIETVLPPVIVALDGYVLGGGLEFACACDVRIASENATFSQPEIDIGIFPGWGGTQRLAKVIGVGKAKEMIYSGRRMDAAEALEAGLVNHVVPADQLDKIVDDLAHELASKSRSALLAAKRAIGLGFELPLESGLEREMEMWSQLFGTRDQREGMRAFLERRKPKFDGD